MCKTEFNWWNTIQAHEKLPNVHVVQLLDMFWLDFAFLVRGEM